MKFLISACLAGHSCRYDGSHCCHPYYQKMVEDGDAVPFCPEVMGGLPTPREPAEIRVVGDEKRVFTRNGNDVTACFKKGADLSAALAVKEQAVGAILKNNSPSCGFSCIYDGTFGGRKIRGQGLAADALAGKGVFLFDEKSFLSSLSVTLRKIQDADYKDIALISQEAFLQDSAVHSPWGAGGPEGYDSVDWYKEAASRGRLSIILVHGNVAGGIFYTLKSARSLWINRIFIKPELQGQGIGRRVIFLLEQKYPGVAEWGLDTPGWAVHNQSFYQSMGFQIRREVYSREAGFNLVVLNKRKFQGGGSGPA